MSFTIGPREPFNTDVYQCPNLETINYLNGVSHQGTYDCEKDTGSLRKSLWLYIKLYLPSLKMLSSLIRLLNPLVILCIIFTNIITFFCVKHNFEFYFQVTAVVRPLTFPLAFLINQDFQRAQKIHTLISDLKSSLLTLSLHVREYSKYFNSEEEYKCSQNKLKQLMVHLSAFLKVKSKDQGNILQKVIYEDFSDLSSLIGEFPGDMPNVRSRPHFTTRLCYLHESAIIAFEKLRIVKKYQTPLIARAYTKVFTFLLPAFMAPLYVYYSKMTEENSSWSPYYISTIITVVFGFLQSLQDLFFNPFVGLFKDKLEIDNLVHWTNESIVHTESRNYHAGRFSVSRRSNNISMPTSSSNGIKPPPSPAIKRIELKNNE